MANSRHLTAGIWLNGIECIQMPPAVYDQVNASFRFDDTLFFRADTESRVSVFPYPFSRDRPPLRINRLYVPSGAQRFAIGHFLVDRDRLQSIIEASVGYPEDPDGPASDPFGSGSWSGPSAPIGVKLEMGDPDDPDHFLTAYLYMMPPVPIALDVDWNALYATGSYPITLKSGQNGLTCFVVTLVDQRFFWASDVISESAEPVSSAGGSGSCPPVPDSFSDYYGRITDVGDTGDIGSYILGGDVAGLAEMLGVPFMLSEYQDLRCLNQGRMIGAKCPETIGQEYEALSAEESITRLTADQSTFRLDLIANSSVAQRELKRVVPQSFVVNFQTYLDGTPTGEFFQSEVLYTEVASGIDAGNGYPGKATFFSWVEATVSDLGGCPTNGTELRQAALDLALQYYKGLLVGCFESYVGVCNFQSNGLLDYVLYELNLGTGRAETTIRRFPWNQGAEIAPVFSGMGSSGGGGATGSCDDCGWLLELPETACLVLTITGARFKCACVETTQVLYLCGSDLTWRGGMFSTCCGCSAVTFQLVEDEVKHEWYGILKLDQRNRECDSSDQTEYYLRNPECCDDHSIVFVGANSRGEEDNCNDDPPIDGCEPSFFTVKVKCGDGCAPAKCCCQGCQAGGTYCLTSLGAPSQWRVEGSGFTGDGVRLNIPWVLQSDDPEEGSCSFRAECVQTESGSGAAFEILVTWAWVSVTVGWRLTFDCDFGGAVYESGPGSGDGEFDCCDEAGIEVSKISSDIGGAATLSVIPVCKSEVCANTIDQPTDTNACNQVALENRSFTVTTTLLDESCTNTGLAPQTIVLTWDTGSSTFKGTIDVDGVDLVATLSPVNCGLSLVRGAEGTGATDPELDSTPCPIALHYLMCLAPLYCSGSGSSTCSDNPDAIEAFVVEN